MTKFFFCVYRIFSLKVFLYPAVKGKNHYLGHSFFSTDANGKLMLYRDGQ